MQRIQRREDTPPPAGLRRRKTFFRRGKQMRLRPVPAGFKRDAMESCRQPRRHRHGARDESFAGKLFRADNSELLQPDFAAAHFTIFQPPLATQQAGRQLIRQLHRNNRAFSLPRDVDRLDDLPRLFLLRLA